MDAARSSSSDTEDDDSDSQAGESTAQEDEEDMQEDPAASGEATGPSSSAAVLDPSSEAANQMADDDDDDDDDDDGDDEEDEDEDDLHRQPPQKKKRRDSFEEAGPSSASALDRNQVSAAADGAAVAAPYHHQNPRPSTSAAAIADGGSMRHHHHHQQQFAVRAEDTVAFRPSVDEDTEQQPTSSAAPAASAVAASHSVVFPASKPAAVVPAMAAAASSSSSSSSSTVAVRTRSEEDQRIIDSLERSLHETNSQLVTLMKDLRECVECPVCFNIPRSPPIPCCRNGHVICARCKVKCDACPKCRSSKIDCVSQVAASIVQRINHPCEFRDEGCNYRGDVGSIGGHEENCRFRLVRCPHWACDETITARNLTHHVIAAECGDSYRDKPLPYQEEMVYTQALDDEEGNGFWKPSLLEFNGITFYLQVEKCGKSRNWYFYIQMEGSPRDCEKYGATIKVSKRLNSERHAVVYNGGVCPIDIKGAREVEASGVGLNIRDAAMEKIFDEAGPAAAPAGNVPSAAGGAADRKGGGDEDRGFKFWVDVDIFKVDDKG